MDKRGRMVRLISYALGENKQWVLRFLRVGGPGHGHGGNVRQAT